ncbi:barstar family protein [Paenibacillus sp. OAS669]|uniref:barstar family protein n=1 Tax=Paenibacillus sp. OAS669 TaxID=2663821 RepID=UPI00178ABA90|nr:barstar family protein [Paenibacillus sp. OAS669]MBE1444839.1 RNAse (barnase) inhibitor barstar [Paenibacillus sp. OAS669]
MINTYTLSGDKIWNLESFFKEFAIAVNAPNNYFGTNLTQFDDCLFGGFGLEAPCVIIWENHEISKQNLDSKKLLEYYSDMKRTLEKISADNEQDYDKGYLLEMIQNCDNILKQGLTGELTLFEHIVKDYLKTVTERAASSKTWTVDLVLK